MVGGNDLTSARAGSAKISAPAAASNIRAPLARIVLMDDSRQTNFGSEAYCGPSPAQREPARERADCRDQRNRKAVPGRNEQRRIVRAMRRIDCSPDASGKQAGGGTG